MKSSLLIVAPYCCHKNSTMRPFPGWVWERKLSDRDCLFVCWVAAWLDQWQTSSPVTRWSSKWSSASTGNEWRVTPVYLQQHVVDVHLCNGSNFQALLTMLLTYRHKIPYTVKKNKQRWLSTWYWFIWLHPLFFIKLQQIFHVGQSCALSTSSVSDRNWN